MNDWLLEPEVAKWMKVMNVGSLLRYSGRCCVCLLFCVSVVVIGVSD